VKPGRRAVEEGIQNKRRKDLHLVQKDSGPEVANLLFRVLLSGDEVHGLHMAEVDLVTHHVRVQQLEHIPGSQSSQCDT